MTTESKRTRRTVSFLCMALFVLIFATINIVFLFASDDWLVTDGASAYTTTPETSTVSPGVIGNGEINSFNYRYSETPIVTANIIGYDYVAGESISSDNKVVLDISNPDVWTSKTAANAANSIFGKIALSYTSEQTYYTKVYVAYSDNGNTRKSQVHDPDEDKDVACPCIKQGHYGEGNTPEPVQKSIGEGLLIDSSDNVITAIYVSGTTWYGKEVSDFNILQNGGKDTVAGNYRIEAVTCTKYKVNDFNYLYAMINAAYRVSNTGQTGDTETISVWDTMSVSNNETVTLTPPVRIVNGKTETEYINLFLTTTLTYGSSISGTINGNLGIDAIYDSITMWSDQIQMSGSGDTEDTYCYAITGDDNVKKDFNVAYGFVEGLSNTAFSVAKSISGYGTIASHLELGWHKQSDCKDEAVQPSITTAAGTYYIRIEVKNNEDWIYEGNGDAVYLVNFEFGGSPYIQVFNVQKRMLRISFKDELGVGLALNEETNKIEVPYLGAYAQVQLANSQTRKTIPTTETFFEAANNGYTPTNSAIFEDGKVYYRNKCPADEAITNLITNEDEWVALGGYSKDWSLIDGANLFGAIGSYFPGTAIRSYNYMTLYLYFAVNYIGSSYDFDLGEYQNEVWVSYSTVETEGQTRLVKINTEANKNKEFTQSNSSELRAYELYGSFAVVAPRVDLALGQLSESLNNGTIPYGTIWSSSEIDFSPVTLNSASISVAQNDSSAYDLTTAEADWRIKVVGDTSQMTDAGYNFVYIKMGLSKEKTEGAKAETDYESYDGTLYSPYSDTLYGGLYYIVYSVYYKLKGEVTPTQIKGINKGKLEVKIGDTGICSVYLREPAALTISKVKVYFELTDYSLSKYYDGTNRVLTSNNTDAVATLKQLGGYTLSSAISSLTYGNNQHYSSILEYDLALNIRYHCDVLYRATVASDTPHGIYYTYSLQNAGSLTDFYIIRDYCYDVEPVLYVNGEKAPDLTGTILYRTMDIDILENPLRITDTSDEDYVEAAYSRSYGNDTRVAVRVARYFDEKSDHTTLLEVYNSDPERVRITDGLEYYADYYYFYDRTCNYEQKYYFFSELPDIFLGVSYILIEFKEDSQVATSGFLLRSDGSKDGFDWDDTNTDIVKFYYDPDAYSDMAFDPIGLFFDLQNVEHKLKGNTWETVVLNEQSTAGTYRIPVNNDVPFINYKFSFLINSTVSIPVDFEITKIKLDPLTTLIYQPEDMNTGRYLIYNKQENVSKVYTSDIYTSFINLNHDELETILAGTKYPKVDNVMIFGSLGEDSLVEVKRFWLPYSDESADLNPVEVIENNGIPVQTELLDVGANAAVREMKLAGWYLLTVSSPETDNYKSCHRDIVVHVHPKTIDVYTTVAIRTYMREYDPEKEVQLAPAETRSKELTNEGLDFYVAYLDPNTYELTFDSNVGSPVYVYYSNEENKIIDTSFIHIYYVGLADGDSFSGNDTQASITLNLNSFYVNGVFTDKAGLYEIDQNGDRYITVSGARKENYTFNYILGALYIKRQSLVLHMEDNQTITYSGEAITPVNDVKTEEGDILEANVIQFSAAYFAQVGGEYKILVRDYTQNKLVLAQISTSPAEVDTHDYYYYFTEYYDVDNSLIDVQKVGSVLSFTKLGTTYTVYESGSEFFYYRDNDSTQGKIYITQKTTIIYRDNGGCYYYADNEVANGKTYLSRNVVPDFNKIVDNKPVGYVDVVDGKNIYIGINESEKATTDSNVINVLYYEENETLYEGGYILKVYAEPGGSSTNYRRTGMYVVFLAIKRLDIDLIDNSTTYQGTTLNPVQSSIFKDAPFVISEFGDYYEGKTLTNEIISMRDGWASVEIEVVEGVQQFASQYSDSNFVANANREFAKYQNGDTTGFDVARLTSDVVQNAGLYVILMKVTISDSYSVSGQQPIDMRKNLRFVQTSSQAEYDGAVVTSNDDSVAYFVLYLVMDRSSDISFSVFQNQDNGDTGAVDSVMKYSFGDDAVDDVDGYFVKTYNGIAMSMDISVIVADFTPKTEEEAALNGSSSNGEIVNIRQIVSTSIDFAKSYDYYRKDNGELTIKWTDNLDISLVHCNMFYLKFIINYDDSNDTDAERTYNSNYATIEAIYQVKIVPRLLSVNIHTGEFDDYGNEYGYKNYGQKNSDVVGQFTISYGDGDEARTNDLILSDEYLREQIIAPTIDWDGAGLTLENPLNPEENDPEGRTIVAGSYQLNTKGGSEPVSTVTIGGKEKEYTDYTFRYYGGFPFVVRKLQYAIGGSSYPLVDIASSGVYTGDRQTISIKKYGWDRNEIGDEEMTDPITKNQYPSYLEGDIGNVVAQYYYVGPIENYDPMIHTKNYFDSQRIMQNGKEIGGPAFELYMNNHDENGGTKVDPVDVGFYLYYIVIPNSTNYLGVDVGYWIYEVGKAELTLKFYDITTQEYVRGYSSRTYTGEEGGYPIFYVEYSDIRGDDNFGSETLVGEDAVIKFKPNDIVEGYTVMTSFGLINPLYIFVDEKGVPIPSGTSSGYMPVDAGVYYVALVFDNENGEYGWSKNYSVRVEYKTDISGNILYPQLEITRRVVGVKFEEGNTRITKTYDGTVGVRAGTVEPAREGFSGNYTFTPKSDNIGLIPGDYIRLNINYTASYYARKDVLDEYNRQSDITVYLTVNSELDGADKDNYILSLEPDENLTSSVYMQGALYVTMIGRITCATANVRFLNENGQSVTTRRVTYKGEPLSAIVVVEGVAGEILTLENNDYTILYSSDVSNYNNSDAPVNCDLYSVLITVKNPNYLESPSTSYLEIGRADVTIEFGGEGVQMYGNVTVGLTATAHGVGDYTKALSVEYYYMDNNGNEGERVEDISLAPAGTYIAVAIYTETDNYNYKRASEEFTIAQRDVYVNDDVFTSMVYNGMSVTLKIYFVDNGNTYYPDLLFEKLVNGVWTPDNYQIDAFGRATIGQYPSNVGRYRVKAYEYYRDFHVYDTNWREFSIDKADLIVKVNDMTVPAGSSFSMSASMKNNLPNDTSFAKVVSGLKYRFYNATTNEYVSDNIPTTPGTYKVMGYGAISENYNITYQFGLLTINKTEMNIKVNGSDSSAEDKTSIVIEGSFAADMQISVSQVENSNYSELMDAFDLFKMSNSEFSGFTVSKVFVFDYTNYSAAANGNSMRIKLHVPDLLSRPSNAAYADGDKYYVAMLGMDNELKIAEGQVEGEYLSFDTGDMQVKAVSILTIQSDESNNYDWLLYVGIAVGVLLIGAAIVVVVRKV